MSANDNIVYLCDLELDEIDQRFINSVLDLFDEYIEENQPSVEFVQKLIEEIKLEFEKANELG